MSLSKLSSQNNKDEGDSPAAWPCELPGECHKRPGAGNAAWAGTAALQLPGAEPRQQTGKPGRIEN